MQLPSLMIRNASILEDDGSFGDPKDVAVANGVIAEVGSQLTAQRDCPTYDLSGMWIMPGVFDCHDHITWSTMDETERLRTPITRWCLESVRNFSATLEAGVTFVRDAAGADPGMRDAIARGYVAGPTLQVCISLLSQTGGHGDAFLPGPALAGGLSPQWLGRPPEVVDGVDEMRKAVRELLRAGVDWIKLCATGGTVSPHDAPDQPQFTVEEIGVAVAEGKRRGVSVMAHAYGGEGLTNAVSAGARSIEHGLYLTEEQAADMATAGCFLVPTLAISQDVVRWAESGTVLPPYAAQKALERIKPYIGDCVKIARAAGVKMVVGTDYIHREQHGNNLEELWYMHAAGLTAEETLIAATKSGAELCGVSNRYGETRPGHIFDAIVLSDDPSDMRVFQHRDSVAAVFKAGVSVKGADLLATRES